MSAVSKVDLIDLSEASRKIGVLEEWMERQELLHGGDRDQPNIEAQPCTISYETRYIVHSQQLYLLTNFFITNT